MPYSSDKLYNDVIRKMMARLASDIKARELMPHLSCLTLTDKEEIEAKRETGGNYNAMVLLVENLRRRENWPEQFISALRNCEHKALADEIQTKYDNIRGINTPTASASVPAAASVIMPASPPAPVAALASTQPTADGLAKVTTATVHNVPKIDSSLLIPGEEAEQSTVPVLVTLPSSLKVVPVESPDFVSVPEAVVPEPEHPVKQPLSFSTTQSELSVNSVVTPSLGPPDGRTPTAPGQTSFDAPLHLAHPVTTSTSQFTTSQFPSSPQSSKVPVAVMDDTSLSKHPIQDTRPPGSDLQQVTQNSLSINQVFQHLERAETVVTSKIQNRTSFQETSWVSSAANFNSNSSLAPHNAANLEEYLSKPEVLREPQSMSISSVHLAISHVDPAVTTERTAMPVPGSSPQQAANYDPCLVTSESQMTSLSSRGQDSIPYLVAQEGLDLNHEFPERLAHVLPNQPEENHYESVTAGLQGEPSTLENIVRYSEIPSIQNNSQPPSADGIVLESLQVQSKGNTGFTSNQSACAVIDSNVSQETKLNASGQMNAPLLEERGEHQSLLSRLPTDSRLIVAAAVGLTAAFLAWKINH